MPKKVYELANELEIGAIDLVEKLKSLGMNVRNHMVTLSDEEIDQAMKALTPSEDPKTAKKKKKATKKKTASKKVTKKKVTKKTVTKKASSKEDATGKKKVVTVKKKSKAEDKIEAEPSEELAAQALESEASTIKASAVEEKPQAEAEAQELVQSEEEKLVKKKPTVIRKKKDDIEKEEAQSKEDVFKEKLHSFTPIYVPEKEKSSEAPSSTKPESKTSSEGPQVPGPQVPGPSSEDEGKDGKSKKRLGDLAAHISKKGVAAKSKDVNTMRADEELKFASGIVGKTIFSPAKKKKVYSGPTRETMKTEVKEAKRVIYVHDGATAEDLAQKLSVKFESMANKALDMNLLLNKDDYLGLALCNEIASLYNYRVENKAFDEEEIISQTQKEAEKSKLPVRDPIITVMGHVDHGKTTLLDYIRSAKVASGEAGGITQHIGAYKVDVKGTGLTFLDTPGHAAFASMRQRGADVTDIVILVVAADDGVMPQTKESVRFCQNADKPVIVAINKMDKEGANPDRVKQELMEFGITPEEWGGDTQFVPISALKGEGVDALLESVQIQAEIMELKANPKGGAEGIVIESKVEQGRGAVSTILIQKGKLKKGDSIVVGETYGRARSLTDYSGKQLNEAGPSTPVQILGLNEAAMPGDTLNVVKNEREAKKIVDNRISERKLLENTTETKTASLEDFFASAPVGENEKKVLKLVVRSDVQGSFEAIKKSLESLGNQEVSVELVGGGVGAITDNDVLMASSVNGYIIGFNMRPVTSARRLAEQKGIDIKNYSIIYNLINDIKLALEGMLEPEFIEKYIGRAEVRDTFNIPSIGVIAGSAVIDGKIERGCKIRLLRDGKIVHDGTLSSLKRFKDNVKEVKNGYECGISLNNFNDVKVDDIFEAYIMEEKKRKLEASSEAVL